MEKVKHAMKMLQDALSEYDDSSEDTEETKQKGEKIDEPQTGNVGDTNEDGEVDYEKFDNLAKKKILLQKMLAKD